ncbi:tetratricopeptide repeat protein [Streptomyces griseorubiginosus]|uniref:tetratricopeptide repeat protein n=1 Tax=Streptomyces griseorubiginosus TaxID=67304 RepID=UPI00113FC6A3|nr:tetratricopeptide repeat protein [Streptomyces griseorubiginosus]
MFGAELFTQTAAAAAGTMVGLMTTDAWQVARHRIARFLRREDVERLEAARAELDAAPPGRQQVILRQQREEWGSTLRGLLDRNPELAGLLAEFVQEFSGVARPVFIQVQQPAAPLEPARAPGALTVAPPLGRLDRRVRGRGPLLDTLKQLVGKPTSGVRVLHGMGGSGKTTVALEIAAHAAALNVDVWWVTAKNPAALSAGMREVVAALGTPADLIDRAWSGRSSATDLLWRRLCDTASPWLLVVDNADEPEHLAPYGRLAEGTGWIRPAAELPGLVLITSRDSSPTTWGPWATLHSVDALEEDDATEVLWDLAGERAGSREDARRLTRRLGGLPLALRIAGSHLAAASAFPAWPGTTTVRTYADYRVALDERFTELLDERPPGQQGGTYSVPVTGTWELSLDLLERRGIAQARPLMRLLCCLGEAPVPLVGLLRPDRLAASSLLPGVTPQELYTALTALADFGLVELHTPPGGDDHARTLVLHPLVRDAGRLQRDLAEHWEEYAAVVADLVVCATAELSEDDPRDWPRWRLLLPHIDAPLALMGDPYEAEDELVSKALRATAAGARHLFRRGWLDRAEEVLDACEPVVLACGPNDPDALEVRAAAAHLLHLRGRLAAAESLFRTVLADTRALFGDASGETADARYALANLLHGRGRPVEAETEYRAVHATRRALLGERDPGTLAARKGVAWMARYRGLLAEAEEEYRLLLDAYRETLGAHHPDTLATRHEMAQVLHERGMFGLAEAELRETLQVCARVLGERHPSTLAVRHDLAGVLRDRGLLAEAEQEFRTVLATRAEAYGEDHPETVSARYGLATVLRDRGWPGDAETEFREVFEVQRRLLGDMHPHTLEVRHNLADLLMERGQLEAAEAEFREVYAARREVLGEQHLLTLSVRHGAAHVLHLRGRTDRAETEYRTVLADCVDTLGPRHPGTLAVRHNLADLLKDQGRLAAAEQEFREVYEARRTVLGEQHLLTLSVRHGAAHVLHLRGHVERAEAEYRTVLADCVETLGPRHPGTLAVRHNLADLLCLKGEPVQAAAEFTEVREVCEEVLGPRHPRTLAAGEALARLRAAEGDQTPRDPDSAAAGS